MAQARPGVPDFELAAQEVPFLSVAETFITAAAAADQRKLAGMLSPAIVARSGAEAVERFLAGEVILVLRALQGAGA